LKTVLTEKKAAKDGGAMHGEAHAQADVLADPGAQTRYTSHGQIPDVEPLRDAKSLPTASQRAYGEVARGTDEDAASTTTGANNSGGPLNARFKGDGTLASVELDERTLKLGDTGRSVRKLQQALFDLSYGPIEVNGTYDQATVDCVKKFQTDHKLAKKDGELDSTTFEAIEMQFAGGNVYADAAHHGPPGLQHTPFKKDAKDVPVHLAETRELDDEDRSEIDAVIGENQPHTSTTATKADTFNEKISAGSYGARIEKALTDKIAKKKSDGENLKKAHDKGKVFSMDAMENVANAAKGQVDKVFGSFAEAPPFDSGVNLHDRYEHELEKQAHEGKTKHHDDAVSRVRYFINNDSAFAKLNQEHSANPTRDAEKDIIDRTVEHVATAHEADLLFINATWSANTERDTRHVNIQRRRSGDDDKDRPKQWKNFGTMIHEYIHVLAHPNWHKYRSLKGKTDSQGGNTLGEGVPELLARTVITQINFHDKALRKAVLGKIDDDGEVPDLDRGYGEPYQHALALVGVVGIHNLFAAYFLGETKLIGA
jgi:hypothetical protein